jgi:glucose-1-phosphate adenylyltransferase
MQKNHSSRVERRLSGSAMAIIMAGGRGQRLADLTSHRAKPATPFGGKYRIIDFTLSNCVNSGVRRIMVLTQYKAHALIQHIQRGWGFLRGELGEYVEIVPAQQQIGDEWYRGTADAVYQNLDIINGYGADLVLVLAGDHVYKMDYAPMLAKHMAHLADITVGVVQVPVSAASSYGVMTVDNENKVLKFNEKPERPEPMPGRSDMALASMGIYVFTRDFLVDLLSGDAADPDSAHDFGGDIIPAAIKNHRVFAYPFENVETRAQYYWRDVGTVDSFYEANLELVDVEPELNLYDAEWPIWTYQQHVPSAKFVLDDEGRRGTAINSMVAGGCIVSGASVRESLLSYNCMVGERSEIHRSVVLPNSRIGSDCRIRHAVLDENVVIPNGTYIGFDRAADTRRFHVTDNGVVLVTPDMLSNRSRYPDVTVAETAA